MTGSAACRVLILDDDPVAGAVLEILAPNGELVEHGQPLIRIQPN